MSVKDDLPVIGEQIIQSSGEKFTGKLQINLHMNQGAICRINVVKDTDLKKPPSKNKRVLRTDP